jgi:hypothetical protein
MPGGARRPVQTGCPPSRGKRLTFAQRAQLLAEGVNRHGENGAQLQPQIIAKFVAISDVESRGYTHACTPDGLGGFARGFMQIDSVHGWGTTSFDPATCADQTWQLYYDSIKAGQDGFKPWAGDIGSPHYAAVYPAALVAARRTPANLGNNAAAKASANASSSNGCVHSWSLPGGKAFGVGPKIGGEKICFDVVIGGLKMALAGFAMMVVGLALLAIVSRNTLTPVAKAVASKTPEGKALKAAARASGRSRDARSDRKAADEIDGKDRPARRNPENNKAVIRKAHQLGNRKPRKPSTKPTGSREGIKMNKPPRPKPAKRAAVGYAGKTKPGQRGPSREEAGTDF